MKFTRVLGQTTMRFPKIVHALTLGLLLSGCTTVTSLQPPYEDKDVVVEPSFVGTWDQDKDNCSDEPIKGLKVVAQPESNSYELSVPNMDDSKKGWVTKYDVSLFRLKDFLFADAVFHSLTVTNGAEISSQDLPAFSTHFFARIWIEGDHVQFAAPNANPLKEAIGSQQTKIQLQEISDDIILTGPTPEIRDFLVKYADDEGIFTESQSCSFTRRK